MTEEERAAEHKIGSSMDWRFLPELPASGQALLFGAADEGLAASFTVTTITYPARLPGRTTRFDLIALPDGLSAAALLPDLAQRLKPDGALYLSFASPWKRYWRPRRRIPTLSSLRRVRQQLARAGLQPVAIYGIFPDHLSPTYLFPLTPAALQYVFRQILSQKFAHLRAPLVGARIMEGVLTHPFVMRSLAHFLPAYAVIGRLGPG